MKSFFLILIFFMSFILSCGGSKGQVKSTFIEDPIASVDVNKLINKAKGIQSYYDHDMLIVLEKVLYRLTKKNKIILEVHQITKVLTDKPKGIGKSVIYFRSGQERISNLEAYTLTEDGKHIEVTDIITDTPFYNDYIQLDLYKDIKVKVIQLPVVKKGSILNLRYQMEIDFPELDQFIEGEFYLSNRYPILKQKGVIIVPKGKKLWFKLKRTRTKPKKITTDTEDYYIIEQDNTPIIHSEPFQLPFQDIAPKISFSSYSSWKKLSNQLYPLLASGVKENSTMKELAEEICSGLSSDEEKSKALYNYVTKTRNIANASIPFGIGGYVPNSPITILQKKYGDSKDKAALLISLLKAVGIEAYFALTNESYDIEPDLPSLKNLNRILVAIYNNGDYTYLDPHSAIVRYGFLPGKNYGKKVLILNPKQPQIKVIKQVDSDVNKMLYNTESILLKDGTIKYRSEFLPTGSYEINERANMIKIALKNQNQGLEQNYREIYERGNPNIQLHKMESENPFDIEKPFRYKVWFRVGKFAKKRNGHIAVKCEIHQRPLRPFSKHRVHDLNFTLPFKIISKNKMKLTKSFKVIKIPENISIKGKAWSYQLNYKLQGDSIVYERIFQLDQAIIPIDDYKSFKLFIDQVIAADKQRVYLSN